MAIEATDTTDWPSQPVPATVKTLLNRFFRLVDDPSPECGVQLSKEVFTPDGIWVHPRRTFTGAEEIAGSTSTSMGGIAYRNHIVKKVWGCNDAMDDLMMFGTLTIRLENGTTLNIEYCARAVIDDTTSETPKLKFFQGLSDSWPLREAMQAK